MSLLHYYRAPGLDEATRLALLRRVRRDVSDQIRDIHTEYCFNLDTDGPLGPEAQQVLQWLLAETFEPDGFGPGSFMAGRDGTLVEVGPRLSFSTAWSTNALAIFRACGLRSIRRVERSRRYLLETDRPLGEPELRAFLEAVHDRMTETPYPEPLESFDPGVEPEGAGAGRGAGGARADERGEGPGLR